MNIRLKERLIEVDCRAIYVIKIFLLIFALGAFSSCETHDYPNINRHSIIFEPGNNETYLFSDHHVDSLYFANRVIPNGYVFADGSSYTFSMEGDVVTVTMGRSPEQVKYKNGALNKTSELLKVSNTAFSGELDPNGFFIIEYPWSID